MSIYAWAAWGVVVVVAAFVIVGLLPTPFDGRHLPVPAERFLLVPRVVTSAGAQPALPAIGVHEPRVTAQAVRALRPGLTHVSDPASVDEEIR